jgi:amidase
MQADIWRMGASDLAEAIRRKKASSREVVEAHLARIEAVNPAVNAVTVVLADAALTAADAADRAVAAGGDLRPLHGVPMTVKENIDVAGSATTQGLVALKDAVPPVDAPHISQMREAGAIPMARTNMPDVGLRYHTDNALRGATKNPWDAGHTAGGSSGGEAAALATGMTPLGMGNDYGGSLRWPAQCCGIASLRTTLGRVPRASALPPEDGAITAQLFSVNGPMARHVRDLRLALSCMSGPSARDPWWTPAPLVGPDVPRPLRVAVTVDPAGEGVDPDVATGVRKAADALRDAGYAVDDVEPPMIAQGRDLFARLITSELKVALYPLLKPVASPDALRFLELSFAVVPELGYADYVAAFAARSAVARAWRLFHEQYPLVLGPVVTMQPFEVGFDVAGADEFAMVLRSFRLTGLVNLLGLPAAAVPVGVARGLPQGVQIIGDRYREDLCLEAAEAIEERVGVLTPIDPR